ncbi:hypothetical protein QVD17_41753 [Tagetes erecta]|uniref:HAT C-terminal dimerisation domain-containing protein n=1 Tax=Tagetes erecta TaxID=13708 RepID=A0AAD8JN36_TARER|nr:hypothetical protein QVD17_41753 [Tagetes erecta]
MAIGSSEIFSSRNELDKYLGEEREPKDPHFDILQWRKLNQCRCPVLAKMARDILAIPVSTVPSESAFSTGGQNMEEDLKDLATEQPMIVINEAVEDTS